MKQKTRIERGLYWERAWKLVEGCSKVSPGCAHCWSESEAHMRSYQKNPKISGKYQGVLTPDGKWNGHIKLLEQNLELPLLTRKPTRWAIWNDLFHEDVPKDFQTRFLAVVKKCPQHTFKALTKRPENMEAFFHDWWYRQNFRSIRDAFPNLYLGVTVESPEYLWRIDELYKLKDAKLFVSIEPMLAAIDLEKYIGEYYCGNCHYRGNQSESVLDEDYKERYSDCEKYKTPECFDCGRCYIDHCPECGQDEFGFDLAEGFHDIGKLEVIICGEESGPGARVVGIDAIRNLKDQCTNWAEIPFFLKQMRIAGKLVKMPELDGRTWDQMPCTQG